MMCAGSIKQPRIASQSLEQAACPSKIVGLYYSSETAASYAPESLSTALFTHAFFAFASISPFNHTIAITDPSVEYDLMVRFVSSVRGSGSCAKALISVGGASFSQDPVTASAWSDMAST